MSEQNSEKIRRVALNMLTRRDYSCYELQQKLRAKGYAADEIKAVLAELVASQLINEARFVENYIYWRRNKGYGPQRISQELQSRGIVADMIAEHLQTNDEAWLNEVRKVWQKHFRGKQPKDFQARAKQMRFMQYRGFTREQIESVLEDSD